jgi:glucose-6-phosphate isomerase
MSIKVDYSKANMTTDELLNYQDRVNELHKVIHEKTGAGNDFLGWLDYPKTYDVEEFTRMKACAKRIQENSDILVVVGIGGSYLGARAVIEALNHSFINDLSDEKRKFPKVMFLGNNISPVYMTHFLDAIEGKDITVNVISKSGTTTEPALAFRIIRKYMENKYGKEASKARIVATTDYKRGALRQLADQEGYETFGIADDMGGRFSVLSSVGMLPIAVSGIDVDELMAGAAAGCDEYMNTDMKENACYQYAAIRNYQLNKGKDIEILVNYEPQLHFTAEWWKQLMGESEGKDGKGLFPAAVDYSSDLHSMGQYVQDGQRILFETIVNVEKVACDVSIESDPQNLDNLNYLVGETMDFVNKNAMKGTILAHVDGGVPNVIVNLESLSPFNYGKLLYFFMKSCAMSCYMIDVNPFNQPGVEDYKKNMFALLGKPGFEALREELLKK